MVTFRGPSRPHFGQGKIPEVSARPSNNSLRNVLPQCVHKWKCKSLGRERLETFAMDDFSFLRNLSPVQEEKNTSGSKSLRATASNERV
jgi:hypothetical protein